jgi:hypothetical protein
MVVSFWTRQVALFKVKVKVKVVLVQEVSMSVVEVAHRVIVVLEGLWLVFRLMEGLTQTQMPRRFSQKKTASRHVEIREQTDRLVDVVAKLGWQTKDGIQPMTS